MGYIYCFCTRWPFTSLTKAVGGGGWGLKPGAYYWGARTKY